MNEIPKFTARPRGVSIAKALETSGRATVTQLVKLTERSNAGVRDALKTLHSKSKVHIGAHEMTRCGKRTQIWFWGDGDDVQEPMTNRKGEVFIPHADEASAWLRNPL